MTQRREPRSTPDTASFKYLFLPPFRTSRSVDVFSHSIIKALLALCPSFCAWPATTDAPPFGFPTVPSLGLLIVVFLLALRAQHPALLYRVCASASRTATL
jgi:hypothetical protein